MTLASAQRLLYLRGMKVYRPKDKDTDLFRVYDPELPVVRKLFEYQVIELAEGLKRKK